MIKIKSDGIRWVVVIPALLIFVIGFCEILWAENLVGRVTGVEGQRTKIQMRGPCSPEQEMSTTGRAEECFQAKAMCVPVLKDEFVVYEIVNDTMIVEHAKGRVVEVNRNEVTGKWQSVDNRDVRAGLYVTFFSRQPKWLTEFGRLTEAPRGCGQFGGAMNWEYNRALSIPPWSHAAEDYQKGHQYEYATDGVKRNMPEAAKWYVKAAKEGHPDAAFALYNMYDTGQGVKKNQTDAVKWLQRSAELGHPGAQVELARKYEKGENGLNRDMNKAIEWYRRSAAQLQIDAVKHLKELGIPEDQSKK